MKPGRLAEARRRAVALGAIVFLLAACDAGASPAATGPVVSSRPLASDQASALGGSGSAGATAIPGFEDWAVVNPQAVSMDVVDGRLEMTLTRRGEWLGAQRGVLFFQPMTGDFRVTASVETTRTSSPGDPPGGNGTVQLAGLMARADADEPENHVLMVVGSDAKRVVTRATSTKNDDSVSDSRASTEPAADLKICRQGSAFTLQTRGYSTADDWVTAATYKRPDLPPTLEVGADISANGAPDIEARFDSLVVESLDPGEAC